MFVTKKEFNSTVIEINHQLIKLRDNLLRLDTDYNRNMSAYTKQLHQLDESNKRLLDYFNVREENIPAKTVLRVKGGPE